MQSKYDKYMKKSKNLITVTLFYGIVEMIY